MATVRHVADATPAMAWRQGQYGAAAAAVGAVGYQAGPGIDERCDLPAYSRTRRPKDEKGEFRTQRRIYIREFGRSVSSKVADALLAHGYLRGALICNEPATCCPDGASSMVSNWRQHALRTRARELDELRAMPNPAWRLNHIARQAERAAINARSANQVLDEVGISERIPEESFRALTEVTDALRAATSRRAG